MTQYLSMYVQCVHGKLYSLIEERQYKIKMVIFHAIERKDAFMPMCQCTDVPILARDDDVSLYTHLPIFRKPEPKQFLDSFLSS